MRTVSFFEHTGRRVWIYKYMQLSPKGGCLFPTEVDGQDLPVIWRDARQLEQAIRAVNDQDKRG